MVGKLSVTLTENDVDSLNSQKIVSAVFSFVLNIVSTYCLSVDIYQKRLFQSFYLILTIIRGVFQCST